MTTLYKPVLIESVEQAEALPAGTSVKRAVWHEPGFQDYYAGVKIGFNTWFTTSPTAERQDALSQHMIGWTALVPIEADKEQGIYPRAGLDGDWTYESRFVTRWEEA